MPDLKKNLLTGEETEAYSGLGDCVHRKLLGVIDKLHFKNHTDTFLGAEDFRPSDFLAIELVFLLEVLMLWNFSFSTWLKSNWSSTTGRKVVTELEWSNKNLPSEAGESNCSLCKLSSFPALNPLIWRLEAVFIISDNASQRYIHHLTKLVVYFLYFSLQEGNCKDGECSGSLRYRDIPAVHVL